jgi:hypothetical protein
MREFDGCCLRSLPCRVRVRRRACVRARNDGQVHQLWPPVQDLPPGFAPGRGSLLEFATPRWDGDSVRLTGRASKVDPRGARQQDGRDLSRLGALEAPRRDRRTRELLFDSRDSRFSNSFSPSALDTRCHRCPCWSFAPEGAHSCVCEWGSANAAPALHGEHITPGGDAALQHGPRIRGPASSARSSESACCSVDAQRSRRHCAYRSGRNVLAADSIDC